MRTFIENYLHFIKNCIRPPYKKLKSLKSGFIENSNFENNRDPWTLESPFSHPFWNYSIKKWLDMTSPLIYVLKSFLDVFSSTNWLTKFYQKRTPGRIFSYCVRARAYTHVLACVYSTRASTCTIYTCFTLPPTRVNPTGLQLSIFQQFWSFVTNIRTSMLPNKFYGRAQPNWDNFVFDFDNCGSYFWKSWPCLICLQFIYLQTDHVMPPSPDFEREQCRKRNPWRSLSIHILNPMFVRISWDSPKKHPNENFQLLRVRSEIIRGARVRLILMSSTFHIAHLYRYTPNISGLPQKLIWC